MKDKPKISLFAALFLIGVVCVLIAFLLGGPMAAFEVAIEVIVSMLG